ncbi:MAG: DUF4188 domain-containing protein [Actinobacteria bacterium]|nr:DUF4188 domain-containing protein [Actinomycetota bacterium]
MAKYTPGRYTADIDGEFVVFIIGARVNKPWRLVKALRALGNLKKMVKHLEAHPEKGMLHQETAGFTSIQYWRSFEALEAFAHDPDPHLEQWRTYTKLAHRTGEAGIWHETYVIAPGKYEVIYDNMPARGLARAGRHVAVKDSSRARGRLSSPTS